MVKYVPGNMRVSLQPISSSCVRHHRSRQCDIWVPTRWRLSMLLLGLSRLTCYWRIVWSGVEFRFGLRESKLILKFQLLHISMEKSILISGCYENHCENQFSDSRRISSPGGVLQFVRNHVHKVHTCTLRRIIPTGGLYPHRLRQTRNGSC